MGLTCRTYIPGAVSIPQGQPRESVSFVASWAECNQTSKGRPRTPEAEVAGLREPGLDDQMRDRDPLLARGDRNNPIAREPPLAERIRVVARSGHTPTTEPDGPTARPASRQSIPPPDPRVDNVLAKSEVGMADGVPNAERHPDRLLG